MSFRVVNLIAFGACATCSLAEHMLTPSNGLQALEDVEKALNKTFGAKMDKALLKIAAPVVQMVDKTVQEVESGKLTKKACSEKVLSAIKALQGLQGRLENTSKVEHVQKLQTTLAAKKAELTKDEGLLKELAEKQQVIKLLAKEKNAAASHQKEDASQEESKVHGLLEMAHDLASAKMAVNILMSGKSNSHKVELMKNIRVDVPKAAVAENKSRPANLTASVPKALQAVLINLQDRAHNMSLGLSRMDAEEKIREQTLDKQIAKRVPTTGSTDAINKGIAMIKQLKKQEQRSYSKARALRQSHLTELNEGIREVETGDVDGLTALMGKMQTEMKTLTSSSNGFLH